MNRDEIVSEVAAESGITKNDASKAVDAFIKTLSGALSRGKDVRFVGFGSFSVVDRKAKQGRNPRTGETINIPASKSVRFKIGKALRESVNQD